MEDFWGLFIVFGIIVYQVFRAMDKKGNKAEDLLEEQTTEDGEDVPVFEILEEKVTPKPQKKRKSRNQQVKTIVLPEEAPRSTVTPETSTTSQSDENINIEDVRRGIIWSEILNRKY